MSGTGTRRRAFHRRAAGSAALLGLLGGFVTALALWPPDGDALPRHAAAPPKVATAPALPAETAPTPPAGLAPPEAAEKPAPLVLIKTEGEIGRGETLAGSLAENGVDRAASHVIAVEMAPVFNFRYARPGDRYRLVQDAAGQVVRFVYERSPFDRYSLQRMGDRYLAARHEPELVRRRARAAGVVSSSLYDAVTSLGERVELAHDFAEIFAWDVDFSRAVRPGDEFAILYERLHAAAPDGSLDYVRPGRILAARYSNAADDYTALYFEPEEGMGGYYRPNGASVERQLLKAPLNYRRISSRYTMSRLHPILKVRRPHPGIDYAAAYGTPVWSVGDGTVSFRGWSQGFGRLVKIRHANGYMSQYGHLSRWVAGLKVGQKVRQKQVIGYVGSSGLSTGPHVCFRLKRGGKYVNPATLDMPVSAPIAPEQLGLFVKMRDELLAQLDPAPLPAETSEAL